MKKKNKEVLMTNVKEDPRFARKHSHKEFTCATWSWALGTDNNIYFCGKISGVSYIGTFYKLGCIELPLDTEDIRWLMLNYPNAFIQGPKDK